MTPSLQFVRPPVRVPELSLEAIRRESRRPRVDSRPVDVQLGVRWLQQLDDADEADALVEAIAGASDAVLRAVIVANPIAGAAQFARLELGRRQLEAGRA